MKKRSATTQKPLSVEYDRDNQKAPAVLREGQKDFVIGLDDCVCCISPGSTVNLHSIEVMEAKEVEGAREWVNNLVEHGHLVCFFTHRPERLRKATEVWLGNKGFDYHSLVMGKPIASNYHYIYDRHVQATTLTGKYAPLIKREHRIQVFG